MRAVYLVYVSYQTYMGRVEELQEGIRRRDEQHAQALRDALEVAADLAMAALLKRQLREFQQESSHGVRFHAPPFPA